MLPAWWPTHSAASRADYLGPEACGQCHPTQAEGQKTTLMAHAASPGAESVILSSNPRLSFRLDRYSYEITRQGDHSVYTVSDGIRSISEPVLFAFGFGLVGQTYVLGRNGSYYESRVTFYPAIHGLDFTLGHYRSVPGKLEDALGNPLSPADAIRCFSCHTTAAVIGQKLDVRGLIPGVTCEACHGPGARHVAAIEAGRVEHSFIFNPAQLKAGELVNFCGACHRTFEEVTSLGIAGVRNVRFQPYRLASSRCWSPDDARISCLSCHDPHQSPHHDEAFYDSKCIACHLSGSTGGAPAPKPGGGRAAAKPSRQRRGAACPVSNENCVTCHMPRVELPGGHFRFADHYIRVVRPGQGYPG